MKFQSYLYNIQLGKLSVAKYQHGDEVVLIAETNGTKNRYYENMRFDNQEQYINWIDNIIGGRDEYSENASILQSVLDVMRVNEDAGVYDA